MKAHALKTLVPDCTGCHACANICSSGAISLREGADGHLYPVIEENICVNCRDCLAVCPPHTGAVGLNRAEEAKAYAVWNRSEAVRSESSSGGVFSELAGEVLRSGGCVFGAAFDKSLDVSHIRVDREQDLTRLRGSKYRQSHLPETMRQVRNELQHNRRVLFSGTPCQVAGLKAFLGEEPENLICVDVACHGVPSARLFRKYRGWWERQQESRLDRLTFRDKSSGWMSFRVKRTFESGVVNDTCFRDDYYMQAFLRDVCLRPSCYECLFTSVERTGDLTLADFWGIEKIHPEWDISNGVSLLLVNTARGAALWNNVRERVFASEEEISEAVKYNPVFRRRARKHPMFDEFQAHLDELPLPELIETWCPPLPKPPRNTREEK